MSSTTDYYSKISRRLFLKMAGGGPGKVMLVNIYNKPPYFSTSVSYCLITVGLNTFSAPQIPSPSTPVGHLHGCRGTVALRAQRPEALRRKESRMSALWEGELWLSHGHPHKWS